MREEAMNMQYLMPGTYLTPFAFATNTTSSHGLLLRSRNPRVIRGCFAHVAIRLENYFFFETFTKGSRGIN